MRNMIKTLSKKQTSHGRFDVYIEIDGKTLSASTTNTMAIDAAFDENYDDSDNTGRFFETREEAQKALVDEILRANPEEFTYKYQVRDSEAGNVIETYASLEEARKAIDEFEKKDKEESTFEPNFYEVYDVVNESVVY